MAALPVDQAIDWVYSAVASDTGEKPYLYHCYLSTAADGAQYLAASNGYRIHMARVKATKQLTKRLGELSFVTDQLQVFGGAAREHSRMLAISNWAADELETFNSRSPFERVRLQATGTPMLIDHADLNKIVAFGAKHNSRWVELIFSPTESGIEVSANDDPLKYMHISDVQFSNVVLPILRMVIDPKFIGDALRGFTGRMSLRLLPQKEGYALGIESQSSTFAAVMMADDASPAPAMSFTCGCGEKIALRRGARKLTCDLCEAEWHLIGDSYSSPSFGDFRPTDLQEATVGAS